MSIEIRHLTHTYSPGTAFESKALDDVNLAIADGEFLALVGHTGSGKSTLVQHLNGLLKPTSGEVIVDGEDLNAPKADRRRIRQKVGLVFQYAEYQLFEETVAKDIAFGPKNQGVSGEELQARVREALELVRLPAEEIAERSPFELSGGQMRRVAIAGVLAMRPSVLVLDEPTAGLDPRGRDSILDMIGGLHSRGTTIVMVSHSMDDVARYATRVAVMGRGRLIAADTPAKIFADAAMMRGAGLDVPDAAKLRDRLLEAGLAVRPDVYTPDGLRDELIRLWKEAKAC